jgi:tetratricopeptide (TPR) repeat protein
LSFCGRGANATAWYAKARAAAVEEGDEIAMGQILYNSAAHRFNNLRLARVRGDEFDDELRFMELMIGSSSHYDVGVRSSAFRSFLPMLNAQLLMLRGDYAKSLAIFSLWLESPGVTVDERVSTVCRADFALTLAQTGELNKAIEQLKRIERLDEGLPPDERAILHHQRSLVYSAAGNAVLAEAFKIAANAEIKRHEEIQSEIVDMVSRHFAVDCN